MANLLSRISINRRVMGGSPCIKGTRITVSNVLGQLAAGSYHSEIISDYPDLTHEDVLAACAYGMYAVMEHPPPLPTERAVPLCPYCGKTPTSIITSPGSQLRCGDCHGALNLIVDHDGLKFTKPDNDTAGVPTRRME